MAPYSVAQLRDVSMASPFPGMDPFLEAPAVWRDFHNRFNNCWCEAVADALPDYYTAILDERVTLVQEDLAEVRQVLPDVAISRWEGTDAPTADGKVASTATIEPVTVPYKVISDPLHESYIEIRHEPDRELVAVLELLSPTNKSGTGRGEYLNKRAAILRQGVHLLELDLLLGGERIPPEVDLPPGDYYAVLTRALERPPRLAEVYAWPIAHVLPTVPVPLRAPDADIHVNLAEVMNTTYERGRYAKSIRYRALPDCLMESRHRDWIKGQVVTQK